MTIACFHLFNDYSGSPMVLRTVLEGLLADGHEVHLYTSRGGVLDEIESPYLKRHYYSYRFSKNPLVTMLRYTWAQMVTFVMALRWLFSRDVVFYINTLLPAGAAAAGRMSGHRVIYHYHENAGVKSAFYRMLACVMQRLANNIICVSAYQASFLRRQEKVTVIPNSLAPSLADKLHPHLLTAFDRKEVLMLSSLKTYKGTNEFVDLARQLPQFRFKLIINDTDDAVKRAIPYPPNNLCILSRQNNVASHYNEASLVVNFTRKDLAIETFGLTALEAMTAGLPVIVPTVGGIAEMVEDGVNGYKIDVENINAISETITKILTDYNLYAHLSQGALDCSRRYSSSEQIKSIERIIIQS